MIDCGGRVIMPGLIDAHWHTIFAALPLNALLSADIGYIFLAASAEAERTLMRGFTTVRDLGGPSFALKQAIDEGLVTGPRTLPSGAMITTTGGHGDMRPLSDLPRSPGGPLSYTELTGSAYIADSADEVRLRVREQLVLRCLPNQTRGRRRCCVLAHYAGHVHLQRARVPRGRRGRRRPEHLCGRARLPACANPAGHQCGNPVYRARASDG